MHASLSVAAMLAPGRDVPGDVAGVESEVRAAWVELMTEARRLRLASHEETAAVLAEAVRAEHGLTGDLVGVLEEAAKAAAEEATKAWEQTVERLLLSPMRLPRGVKEALAMVEGLEAEGLCRVAAPFDQVCERTESWVEAMKRVLPAEAFAEWKAGEEAAVEQRRRRMEELLAAGLKREAPQERYREKMEERLVFVWEVLGENRAVKQALEERVETWAKAFEASALAHSREWLSVMDVGEGEWAAAEKRGSFFSQLWMDDRVEAHWEELRELLPEQVRVALMEAEEALKRHARVLGEQLRVVIVDDAVALTREQRERIKKLAATMPVEADWLKGMSNYGTLEPWEDWKEGHLKALNAVLTNEQQRQWPQRVKVYERARLSPKVEVERVVSRHPGAGPRGVEEVEGQVSAMIADGLMEKQWVERLRASIRAEEVIRVTGLEEGRARAVRLMAKGAAAMTADHYLKAYGDYVRRNLMNATAENVDVLLRGVAGVSFSNRQEGPSLLEQWVEANLTEEERAGLEREERERADLAVAVASQLALATAEEELVLRPGQREALLQELRGVLGEYGPDIDTYFSYRYSAPWYLSASQSPMPCAGIPEERVKAILTAKQWEVWEREVLPRASNYWESIEQNRHRRLEREKQEAAKKDGEGRPPNNAS